MIMWNMEKAIEIRNLVFETIGFQTETKITVVEHDGVYAEKKDGKVMVGGGSLPMLARAFFQVALNETKGYENFRVEEVPHFADCGIMLDMSRNGVMKVEAVKRYINYMVSVGMNTLWLYTEDTYCVEEYPYMGYMRGRYSQAELKEIDDYAFDLGVEVVPCIQTLGHMTQYLKWGDDKTKVKADLPAVMLVKDEDTYRYIEKCVETLRKTFRTKKINIGMDEAKEMGRGKFLDKYGQQDWLQVFLEHLKRVCDICHAWDFQPMMWSDMLCCYSSPIHRYHDPQVVFSRSLIEALPDVDMIYWNYGANVYDELLDIHKTLQKKIIFAGGAQTWFGYLPWYEMARENAVQGLESCLNKGIDTAILTIWNDDGNETNAFLALNQLPFYSEYCFKGLSCTAEDIDDVAELLTGAKKEDLALMFSVNMRVDDSERTYDEKNLFLRDLFYSDILYEIGNESAVCGLLAPALDRNVEALKEKVEYMDESCEYAYYIHKILSIKVHLRMELREAYRNKKDAYLRNTMEVVLPELIETYAKLYVVFKKMWYRDYKPFGLEVMAIRFGGIEQRLKDIIERIGLYLENGDPIAELEEEVLPTQFFGFAKSFFTPSDIY